MLGIGVYVGMLIAGFILLMFLRVTFEVGYKRDGTDDRLRVEMTFLRRLIRYKTEIPVIDLDHIFLDPFLKVEADIEGVVSDPIEDKGMVIKIPILQIIRKLPVFLKAGITLLNRYREVLYGLLGSIRCHHLKWTTHVGLGDPADTGVAIGLLWSIKGLFSSVFSNNIGKMEKKPHLLVVPCFDATCFRLDFHCIFDMRIGHIIIAGLKFVKLRLKP